MVQLQNPDRLNQIISFGTVSDEEDDNGTPMNVFQPIGGHTLCGRWSLSTNQVIQLTGLQRTNTIMVVVHHRRSWNGITHAQLNGQLYQVTNVNADPLRNETAYDQVTLTQVGDQDG